MVHRQKNPKPVIRRIIKIGIILCLTVLAYLYSQLTIGAAGIGIWVQALPALLATVALIIGILRAIKDKPTLIVMFWGTLPAWLIHIPITIIIEDESPIFVIATALVPLVSGTLWLTQRKKQH